MGKQEILNCHFQNLKKYIQQNFLKEQKKKEMNTIRPNVEIKTSFDDFIKGINSVHEWVKISN